MIKPTYQNGFVELNRKFYEIPHDEDVDLSQPFHLSSQLSWSDLIQEHRVVLLSEAGSGKTAEIRNVAKKLCEEDKTAFFIRLEHIPIDFEDAFEVGTFEQFQGWLLSGDEGWLLLDSVDEARLRSPGDFEIAIRKLGRQIATAKDRAHILITGRTSAWRPKTDLEFCTRHLQFASTETVVAQPEQVEHGDPSTGIRTVQQGRHEDSTFKLVKLDELRAGQIEVFARAKGITNTSAFLDAIERADAWSFTARPQDLEELTEFWTEEGRTGSRLELMKSTVSRRLTERDQDRADTQLLSLEDAHYGARILAAVATLGKEQTICVPDGSGNSKGIQIRDALPGWDDKKQATLLSRPIFDEAIYGTVRFHHRSVREYLAAKWLTELLDRETSRRKIEGILFRKQYGLDVIVPTLRPVLPWLAINDRKICNLLRQVAPEIMFEGGDPSQLPLEIRQVILHEVCEKMANGATSRSVDSYEAIQRFANKDLEADIRGLLNQYEKNDELTFFLLRMVWLGELKGVLPEALAKALSPSLSTYSRIAAFRAVKALGSEDDVEKVRQEFLKEGPELKREWLAELVQDTEASNDSITWLLAALAKCEEMEPYSLDRLAVAVCKFAEATDSSLLPELVAGLNESLDHPPVIERRYCEVSEKFGWLLKAAAQSVERLVQERSPAALNPSALSILQKYRATREYGTDELRDAKIDFSALVPEWPELNHRLFWHEIDKARIGLNKNKSERLDEFWRAPMFHVFWRFGEQDFDYVVEQISSQSLNDNRLVALSLAFRLYVDNGRPRRWRERLKRVISADSELSGRLSRYLTPPAQGEKSRRSRKREAAWNRRMIERERSEKKRHDDWKKYLVENLERIRNPDLPRPHDISTAQWYLYERMREKRGGLNRWTDGEWEYLIEEQGEAVARAFRDGAAAYWRRNTPKLRSEGAPFNQTPIEVIFGLTGLSIEARETSSWACTLSGGEVELACRYASYELNGFPVWFPGLYEKHHKRVSNFLLNEIKYELSIEKVDVETHYVLSDVAWSGEWAWNEIAPALLAFLRTEPNNLTNLRKLLRIILGSSITDEDIRELSARKCKTIRRHSHLAIWYAVWTGVEPSVAIPAFTTQLAGLSKHEECIDIAMRFVTELLGGRLGDASGARHAYREPQHLKDLYLLAHRNIRREEDIDRAGTGAYTPSLRDNAQEARDSLARLLNEIPGKEAFLALQEISEAHPQVSSRPWFASLAKAKAEQDADFDPWTPSQVREFQDSLERTPANHRELAELAILRLLDLKDDLENGDSSIAQILKGAPLETDMRKFIGRELREKASGRYSIPQEEELADAKKPDLRFHGKGFDGPVPGELKLADNWSGPELFERLENQLCGDYLRDRRSDRGLFVLVYRGVKKGWDVPGSAKRVDFTKLVHALQEHWEQISPKFSGIEEVTVIGIDLTKRTG
ncbi:MAG: hypothetical protein WDZ84_11125 [Rhodovibrionaceae bacterium]